MIYELVAYNTDRRYDDVRWRQYTRSKRYADRFARIPKIQFSDSGHGIVFSASEHTGKRKPEIRVIREYVTTQLAVLQAQDELDRPKKVSRKQLEPLCRQLAGACQLSVLTLKEWHDFFAEKDIEVASMARAKEACESALEAAKKAKVIDG